MLAFDVIDCIEAVMGESVEFRVERKCGVERIVLQTAALTDEQLDQALRGVAAIIGSVTRGVMKTSIELVS